MKPDKSNRSRQMTFELNEELKRELDEIHRITKISRSQYVRDAVWEKIALTKQTHPAFSSQFQTVNQAEETAK